MEVRRPVTDANDMQTPHSLPARTHTPVPVPLSSFVGREREVEEISAMLRGGQRLLTLLGPGGVGKTRLALEVGRRVAPAFAGGVRLAGLAAVQAADPVIPAIARAMGLDISAGDPLTQLAAYLQEEHLLLLVDNFEHVLDAAPSLAALLQTCPRVSCLVTSRAALRVSGERKHAVAPLCPEAAAVLFLDRARAVRDPTENGRSDADTVCAICARVDHLPLAIELAAARARLFTPHQLLQRLVDGTARVLTGGPRDLPARQRTPTDTIAWSHQLLDAPEQALLARLSVFSGSFAASAISEVCGGDPVGDSPWLPSNAS